MAKRVQVIPVDSVFSYNMCFTQQHVNKRNILQKLCFTENNEKVRLFSFFLVYFGMLNQRGKFFGTQIKQF
jgi:hypothetical protein